MLENYHASKLFDLCAVAEVDVLRPLTGSQYGEFRKMAIDFVLATDVTRHSVIGAEIEHVFGPRQGRESLCRAQCACACACASRAPNPPRGGAGGPLNPTQRRVLLRLSVMCGDVSHVLRSREQSLQWAGLLAEEFRFQVPCCFARVLSRAAARTLAAG